MNDYTSATLHAKAIRLKGEGFEPGEWKNKNKCRVSGSADEIIAFACGHEASSAYISDRCVSKDCGDYFLKKGFQ